MVRHVCAPSQMKFANRLQMVSFKMANLEIMLLFVKACCFQL